MPDLMLIKTVLREAVIRERSPRVPEPDMAMVNHDSVVAYTRAGRDAQLMMQSYLFSCAQICEVIRPGDTVIELACGPATLFALVAKMNPQTRFIAEVSPIFGVKHIGKC